MSWWWWVVAAVFVALRVWAYFAGRRPRRKEQPKYDAHPPQAPGADTE